MRGAPCEKWESRSEAVSDQNGSKPYRYLLNVGDSKPELLRLTSGCKVW